MEQPQIDEFERQEEENKNFDRSNKREKEGKRDYEPVIMRWVKLGGDASKRKNFTFD